MNALLNQEIVVTECLYQLLLQTGTELGTGSKAGMQGV